jgi:hypothetical protein
MSATTTKAIHVEPFSASEDSRENTGEVICEANRKRKLEGEIRVKLVYALSTLLALAAVIAIGKFFHLVETECYQA